MQDSSMPFNIEVVVIHEGQKHPVSFLNEHPEVQRRFPEKTKVNRNYASLKARKTGGTIEVFETMIIVKGADGQILWQDHLTEE